MCALNQRDDAFRYDKCLNNISFNKSHHVELPYMWSIIEESTPHGLPEYFNVGASWNLTGTKHSICAYALLYPGGIPGNLIILYNRQVRIKDEHWTKVSGVEGVYECSSSNECTWVNFI